MVLKLMLIGILLLSDCLILRSGLVYASSGDAKAAEYAKKQLQFGFILHLVSLVGLYAFRLMEKSTTVLTTLDNMLLYGCVGALGFFLFFFFGRFFAKEKAEDTFLNLTIISFLFWCLMCQIRLVALMF